MTVVVGYDGSPLSEQALATGISEARERGTSLVVVLAWTFPYPSPDPAPYDPYAMARDEARSTLDQAVAEVQAAGIAVEGRLVEEAAGAALVDASEGADLVVVGSHGHGLRETLLGSVSTHVERHASCPVLIVRDR